MSKAGVSYGERSNHCNIIDMEMWMRPETAKPGRWLVAINFDNPQISDGRHITIGVWNCKEWIDDDGRVIHHRVIGWMPLPLPPE